MPIYRIAESEIEINRSPQACLLDTGVLVAAFNDRDTHHENAQFFFDKFGPLYMPLGVVVETWGVLVGKGGDWRGGYNFLAWLNTPGKVTLIPEMGEDFDEVRQRITARGRIDLIDVLLLRLALDITSKCGLNPPLRIATLDTSDFYRMYERGLKFGLYDLKHLLPIDFE